MKPSEIESMSFGIIDAEAGPHGFSSDQWSVVRRIIHTSADFDYLQTVRFHPRSIPVGIEAIRRGRPIITDTNMARVGIRDSMLSEFGTKVHCYMEEAAVHRTAAENGTTRARAAVDFAADALEGGIYVVGNAPTALMRLVELIGQGRAKPDLVIGFPVGFVNAAESKAALLALDTPFITNTGRKGGSNVAAAVVNALVLLAAQGR
jgi:precorrin-8X/cobalt-precorrin-8 methylmutase